MWMRWVGLEEGLISALRIVWITVVQFLIVWIIVAILEVLISKMLIEIRINLHFLLKLESRVPINLTLGFQVVHLVDRKLGWCSQSKISNSHKINKIIILVNNLVKIKIKKKLAMEYQHKLSCLTWKGYSRSLVIIRIK